MGMIRALKERDRLGLKREDLLRETAFVASKWIDAQDSRRVCNPAPSQVREAVAAAASAEISWSARAAADRASCLRG